MLPSSTIVRFRARSSSFGSRANTLKWARVSAETYVAAGVPRPAARSRNSS
jgi:hypothetical protein